MLDVGYDLATVVRVRAQLPQRRFRPTDRLMDEWAKRNPPQRCRTIRWDVIGPGTSDFTNIFVAPSSRDRQFVPGRQARHYESNMKIGSLCLRKKPAWHTWMVARPGARRATTLADGPLTSAQAGWQLQPP
jgi:hypothetical protein